MWILILTLTFGSGGAAIQDISFNNEVACRNAGDAWVRGAAKEKVGDIKSAICVYKGGY